MDTQYIDGFIGELLHINEVADNKLIDLNACGGTGTYFLSHTCADQSAYALPIYTRWLPWASVWARRALLFF